MPLACSVRGETSQELYIALLKYNKYAHNSFCLPNLFYISLNILLVIKSLLVKKKEKYLNRF